METLTCYYKISDNVVLELDKLGQTLESYIYYLLSNEYFFRYEIDSDQEHLELLGALSTGYYKNLDWNVPQGTEILDSEWNEFFNSEKFLPLELHQSNEKIFRCSFLGSTEKKQHYQEYVMIPFFGMENSATDPKFRESFQVLNRFIPALKIKFFESQYVIIDETIPIDILLYSFLTRSIVCFVGISPPDFVVKKGIFVYTMKDSLQFIEFINQKNWNDYEKVKIHLDKNYDKIHKWMNYQLTLSIGTWNKKFLKTLNRSTSLKIGVFYDLFYKTTTPVINIKEALSCWKTVEKIKNKNLSQQGEQDEEKIEPKLFIYNTNHPHTPIKLSQSIYLVTPIHEYNLEKMTTIVEPYNLYVYASNTEPKNPWLSIDRSKEKEGILDCFDLVLSDEYEFNKNILFPGYISSWFLPPKTYLEQSATEIEICESKGFEISFLFSLRGMSEPIVSPILTYTYRQFIMDHHDSITNPKLFYITSWNKDLQSKYPTFPVLPDFKECLYHSQYNICVENSKLENYFTEKIIDCFLTHTVPIYIGCSNIGEYFDRRGILFAQSGEEVIDHCNKINSKTYFELFPYVENNYKMIKYILLEYGYPLMSKNYLEFFDHYYNSCA